MKRILTLSAIIIIVTFLCSCGSSGNFRYDSVYDNETKQYISLGDTKQSVVDKMGSGDNDNTEYVEYDDKGNIVSGIRLEYSSESKVEWIDFATMTKKSRYSFINISSKDDFIRIFPNLSDDKNVSVALFKLDEETQEHYINTKNSSRSLVEDIYMEASFSEDKGEPSVRITIGKFSDCHAKHYLKDLKEIKE